MHCAFSWERSDIEMWTVKVNILFHVRKCSYRLKYSSYLCDIKLGSLWDPVKFLFVHFCVIFLFPVINRVRIVLNFLQLYSLCVPILEEQCLIIAPSFCVCRFCTSGELLRTKVACSNAENIESYVMTGHGSPFFCIILLAWLTLYRLSKRQSQNYFTTGCLPQISSSCLLRFMTRVFFFVAVLLRS